MKSPEGGKYTQAHVCGAHTLTACVGVYARTRCVYMPIHVWEVCVQVCIYMCERVHFCSVCACV